VAGGQDLNKGAYFIDQPPLQGLLASEDLSREGGGVGFEFVAPLPLDVLDELEVGVLANLLEVLLAAGVEVLVGREDALEQLATWLEGYSLVAKCLWSMLKRSSRPLSLSFWKMTPMLPTMLDLSATTWSPAERIMYPPEAATSRAKVYSLRLCLLLKSCSFSPMIWLCTGSPPGELTTTARATACEVPTFLSRLTMFSVLGSAGRTSERGWGRTR
jgi:hypothetical protein